MMSYKKRKGRNVRKRFIKKINLKNHSSPNFYAFKLGFAYERKKKELLVTVR
jgi:hypothetical protein